MKQHVRFIPVEECGLHVREAADGQSESRRVEGRPIIFGVRSRNLTPWSDTRVVYEILEPGCLSPELMQRSDVLLNINHSTKVTDIMGRCRNGNGTLELTLRDLHVEMGCELPKTNCANDTLELIKRGDISGMSFAFNDDWQDSENGVSYERTNETVDGKEVWLRHVKKITDFTSGNRRLLIGRVGHDSDIVQFGDFLHVTQPHFLAVHRLVGALVGHSVFGVLPVIIEGERHAADVAALDQFQRVIGTVGLG